MSDALKAEYERWCDAFHEGSDAVKRIAQETLDLRAEVKRLTAILTFKRAASGDEPGHTR